MMLSNLIVTNRKVVFIIDEQNRERIAVKFVKSLLLENGEKSETIKTMQVGSQLKHAANYEALLNECSNNNNDITNTSGYNVVLPTLADLFTYQPAAYLFEFINKIRHSEHVRRLYLWASPKYLQHPFAMFIQNSCEYIADLVVHLKSETLSLTVRKLGGAASCKRYACNVTKTQFLVTPLDVDNSSPAKIAVENPPSEPATNTFKIELDEDEVISRNALTLPYERSRDSRIIYTPDANDDFDEEDPDEDLNL